MEHGWRTPAAAEATAELKYKLSFLILPVGLFPALGLILMLFEGLPMNDQIETFASGYRKEWPKWQRNTRLEQCYKWLTEFGYQMSDEEIRMMSGTHECYKKEAAKDGET